MVYVFLAGKNSFLTVDNEEGVCISIDRNCEVARLKSSRALGCLIILLLFSFQLAAQDAGLRAELQASEVAYKEAHAITWELQGDVRQLGEELQSQVEDLGNDLPKVIQEIQEADTELRALAARAETLAPQVPEAGRLVNGIRDAGKRIAEAYSRLELKAADACLQTDGMRLVYSVEERQYRLSQAREDVRQARIQHELAQTAYEPVAPARQSFDMIWLQAQELEEDFKSFTLHVIDWEEQVSDLEGRVDELLELKDEFAQRFSEAGELLSAAEIRYTEAESRWGASQLTAVKSALEELETQLDSLREEDQSLFDLSRDLDLALDAVEEETEALSASWGGLFDRYEDASEAYHPGGALHLLREHWLTAEGSHVVIKDYLERIEYEIQRCENCLLEGEKVLSEPIMLLVPDVEGKSVPDALRTLDDRGLRGLRLEGDEAPVPGLSYKVQFQQPAAGRQVEVGEQVVIKVYQAHPSGLVVPELYGLSLQEADQLLERQNLRLEVKHSALAPTQGVAYTIFDQNPPAGEQLESGQEVSVAIYGAYTSNRWVPNLLGLDERAANSLLKAAELNARVEVGKAAPAEQSVGRVFAQNPSSASFVEKGALVTLTVYGETEQRVLIPDLSGLDEGEVRTLLEGMGYGIQVAFGDEAPRPELAFHVDRQKPEAGSEVEAGALITVILYREYEEPESLTQPRKDFVPGPEGLYVACRSYFPRLPKTLEQGQKYRDWIRTQTADQVRLAPAEAPVFFFVGGAGLRAYPVEFFRKGKQLASSIDIMLTDSSSGSQHVVSGSLLLEVVDVFASYDSFVKKYPKEQYANEGQDISFIRLDNGAGTFSESGREGLDAITYSGGPLVEGWSDSRRAGNLVLYRGILDYFDCFVASMALGRGAGEDLTILRRFRDEVLATFPEGQRFIDLYYQVGPHLAMALRQSGLGMDFVREGIENFIQLLQHSEDPQATQQALGELLAEAGSEWLATQQSEQAEVVDPFSFVDDIADTSPDEQVLSQVIGRLGADQDRNEHDPAKHATMMGDLYLYGEGVPVDYAAALEWYLKAAELGVPEAMNNAGYILEKGLTGRANRPKAFTLYLQAAEAGLPIAMNNVGWMYYNGLGVDASLEDALEWYHRGAEAGNQNAQANLGKMYLDGVGVEKDTEQARSLFLQAGNQGQVHAQFQLGALFYNGIGGVQDYEQAALWYGKAAEQGHQDAQSAYGWMWERGVGLQRDYVAAASWYRKAAGQGNATSQNNLGWLYEMGFGVSQSYQEAAHWYRQAAEQGFALAQNNLGILYLNGRGVPLDEEEAFKLFSQAAHGGESRAMNNVGYMYEMGRGTQRNPRKALEWYRRGADAGDATAQYNVGRWLDYGIGGQENQQEAIYWYQRAADQEQLDAIERLNELGVEWRDLSS